MITVASVINEFANVGILPTGVIPSIDNDSISIYFISGNRYADIELFDSGEVLAAMSNRKDAPVIWKVDDIVESVSRIRDFIDKRKLS